MKSSSSYSKGEEDQNRRQEELELEFKEKEKRTKVSNVRSSSSYYRRERKTGIGSKRNLNSSMVTHCWGNMKYMSKHLPQINVHEKKVMALNIKKN
jgi:hypothetical protein